MRARALALLGLVWAMAGCKKKEGDAAPAPSGPFTVYVSAVNQGYFDVNVYLMRGNDAFGRRLGTVTGNNTVTFKFPDTDLQAGGRLQLGARSVASRSVWVSPVLSVGPGMISRLTLVSNPNGDLSRSQLFIESGSSDYLARQVRTTASPTRAITALPSLSPQ